MTELEARVLHGAPDPMDAQRRYERFVLRATECGLDLARLREDCILILTLCCQRAPYLATLLARDPRRLLRVGADSHLRRAKSARSIVEELTELCASALEVEEFDRILRVYRGDELVRLGVREMELGTPFEVGEELSHLADACLDAAIDFHGAILQAKFGEPMEELPDGGTARASLVVIGMGKLGGAELNFSSDIDLIYFYSSDAGGAGDLSLQEYFGKLCRRVTASIGDVSEQDSVFRVDLRLRPEGSRGTIANSIGSAEIYYASFGRTWERQAWLKARPCAGNMKLGDEVMAMMRPFIYSKLASNTIITEVRGLNQRIKSELGAGAVDTGFDLKNGQGGIREIEFFVQALQLIHGPHRPKLRTRSTIVALNELLFAGLVSEEERHGLAEAYRYLRHLEHMIQLESGRQTQRLPTQSDALESLARRTKHKDADDLRKTLNRHTAFVKRSFSTLGKDEQAPPSAVRVLLDGNGTPEQERALLASLGFRDPEQAWRDFERARNKALSPFGGAAMGPAMQVAPLLLAEISRSPDPDQALRHTGNLIGRRGSWSALWGMMHENPDLLRLVASVFGTSEYLSKHFISHPELFDTLLSAGLAKAKYGKAELWRSLEDRKLESLEDREEQWNSLAEFKNGHVLRIGLADIAGALDPEEVCSQLSELADVCVQCAYSLVATVLEKRHGKPIDAEGQPVTMAVMAMGKLGSRELGYASDLDLVFVFSASGESDGARSLDATTYMSRIAQRLMRGLTSLHPGGRLYEIDTRLRPSGSQGLLVSSLAAWQRYHEEDAKLWEKQSLTKLRYIAGDAALGAETKYIAEACIYGPTSLSKAALASGIATMRDRIWKELVAPRRQLDLKAGYGGLIDIEFAAQYLQLAYGSEHPALRGRSTTDALELASDLGLADSERCALLVQGYQFLRRLEHRLRIVHDRSEHQLPQDPIELDKLARRAGYPDGAQLVEDFHRWCQEVHEAYLGVLGVSL